MATGELKDEREKPDDADESLPSTPLGRIHDARVESTGPPDRFDEALLAELRDRGEYGLDSSGATFISPEFFSARFRLLSLCWSAGLKKRGASSTNHLGSTASTWGEGGIQDFRLHG